MNNLTTAIKVESENNILKIKIGSRFNAGNKPEKAKTDNVNNMIFDLNFPITPIRAMFFLNFFFFYFALSGLPNLEALTIA